MLTTEYSPSHYKIGLTTLILLNIVIVGSLQMLPSTAMYGSSIIFFYAIATLGFFIPLLIFTSKMAVDYPITGGSYVWVQAAFGKKMGFFTVCILWLCNLIWYPTIFSLIATATAYLINPSLTDNKDFIFQFQLTSFWIITILNCFGLRISSWFSNACAVLGIIVPMLIVIILAAFYWHNGYPIQIQFSREQLIPHLSLDNLGFLIQIIVSLVGLEMAAVHAGDVHNPQRNFPLSLIIAGIVIVLLLTLASLAIAMIVPHDQISVLSGLMDAFKYFFTQLHLSFYLPLVFLLIVIGNLGTVTAWMLSSTRGMHVGLAECGLPKILHRKNRWDAPMSVLIMEALLFTGLSVLFYCSSSVAAGFWLLLVMAEQVNILYYILLFSSYIKLHPTKKNWVSIGFMLLGILTNLLTLVLGFFPPSEIGVGNVVNFEITLLAGILVSCAMPWIFLMFAKTKTSN